MNQIFVNMISRDLKVSQQFYEALGFKVNPDFSTENGLCIVVSDTIYLMVLLPEFFTSFTKDYRELTDPLTHINQMNSISVSSKDEVDRLIENGCNNKGKVVGNTQDLGYMYSRDLQDPYGNIIGFFWMNQDA